jgi:predicted  nucleic acid-binding Zn-ribbon protein
MEIANTSSVFSMLWWCFNAISGITLIFCAWRWKWREEQLPLATYHDDLQKRCAIEEEKLSSLEAKNSDYAAIAAQKDRLEADNDILQDKVANMQEEKVSLELQLTGNKGQLVEQEYALTKLQEEKEKLEEEIKQLSEKKEEGTRYLQNVEQQRNRFEQEQCDFQHKLDQMQLIQQQLEVEITDLRKEKKALEEDFHDRRDQIAHELGQASRAKEALDAEIHKLHSHNACDQEQFVRQLNDLRSELSAAQQKKEELQTQYCQLLMEEAKLKGNIDSYKEEIAGRQEDAKLHFSDIVKPCFMARPSRGDLSEADALSQLLNRLKKCGLNYSKRLLYSFHTSLKINDISPLVVLAGISGTGKSELPRRYAQAMGIHFLSMAVQPRWDSPQDIFGFYNYLEKQYKGTDLTRAMLQAERYNSSGWPIELKDHVQSIGDQMVMVLFDEMNLARVEYYFSDFLSKLEMRRGIDPRDERGRKSAEMALQAGCEHDIRLYIDRNVLIVGTMNEDESTQMLSDKVLDRANTLRFGWQKTLSTQMARSDIQEDVPPLSFDTWRQWLQHGDARALKGLDKIKKRIDDLNEAMQKVGRPFGHRVSQAIISYVSQYPCKGDNMDVDASFADQIELRIMPKLRNLAIDSESREGLDAIKTLLDDLDDHELLSAFNKSRKGDFFHWQGVERS